MHNARHQQGISLVMSLIMLLVLSLIAVSATHSTTSSLRIVGNMQAADESLIAAQAAIEDQLSQLSSFTAPSARNFNVDIDHDGTNDYKVTLAPPVCVVKEDTKQPWSATLSSLAPKTTFWEFTATVQDLRTGALNTVKQGAHIDLYPSMGC